MAKSIKLKNNNYVDSTGIVHNRTTLNNYIGKMDANCNQVINGYNSIGQNPNFDSYTKVGFYPFYEGYFPLVDNTTESISWGCLIVIPYNYGTNNDTNPLWCLQVAIGGTGWNSDPTCKIFVRRINYYGGATKWTKLM